MIKTGNVEFSYGNNKVLDNVSMTCKKNKFVGIIGPNGSGKSTLLKCIYRVLEPYSGTILLDDENLFEMSVQKSATKMSVVAQHTHSSFEFVVEDMVLMGRSPYKKSMERNNKKDFEIVHQALKSVDMLNYRKRLFSTLSGGEMQRIILARALAQEPECLVLDEPTNHLDIKHQLMLLNIVKNLEVTVVAAIHDLNIAMNYCDYIYVIKDGLVKYEGHPEEVIVPEVIKDVFGVSASIVKNGDDRAIVFKEVL